MIPVIGLLDDAIIVRARRLDFNHASSHTALLQHE